MENYVITIGRQFGSGGRELAKVLSQKLGIPYYDKELLMQAAKESGISENFFVNNDERMPSFNNGIMPYGYGVNGMTWYSTNTSISDDNLYRTQSDFIRAIAAKGPCVIVGRTADYVLRDHPNVINLFLTADIEDCIARVQRRGECGDHAKARKLVERTNKLRASFYNFYTDKKWGDTASYDLCINSSRIAISEIAELVVEYLKRRVKDA